MIIALTGTPGVGKTSVAKELEKKGFKTVDLNRELVPFRIEKDEERDSWIVDVEKAKSSLRFPDDCIIEGHLSHFFEVDWVVVLRCEPQELKKRLEAKGWDEKKIRENLEAEAMNIISDEARELCDRVCDIDTTKRVPEEVAKLILEKQGRVCRGLDFFHTLTSLKP